MKPLKPLVDPARSRRGRNAKARGKADEREIARRLGGQRYPADTGGEADIDHPTFCIQVKGGAAVATQVMRDALASARAAAVGTGKLPTVALVDRRGSRNQRWLCFDLEEFAAFHGYGPEDVAEKGD